jgi:hypothetical protein
MTGPATQCLGDRGLRSSFMVPFGTLCRCLFYLPAGQSLTARNQ